MITSNLNFVIIFCTPRPRFISGNKGAINQRFETLLRAGQDPCLCLEYENGKVELKYNLKYLLVNVRTITPSCSHRIEGFAP